MPVVLRTLATLFVLVCVTAAGPAAAQPFAEDIARFEARDRTAPPDAGAVLFVGSSSIRLWRTLDRDLAPLPVINRGFGGATLADVIRYADRIVLPYRPAAVVLYAGENDLARGASPAEVTERVDTLVTEVRATLDVPVVFLSIKTAPARQRLSAAIDETNRRIAELAAATPDLRFLDVAAALTRNDGTLRTDHFAADSLHLSATGYDRWTAVVRPVLADLLTPAPAIPPAAVPAPEQPATGSHSWSDRSAR